MADNAKIKIVYGPKAKKNKNDNFLNIELAKQSQSVNIPGYTDSPSHSSFFEEFNMTPLGRGKAGCFDEDGEKLCNKLIWNFETLGFLVFMSFMFPFSQNGVVEGVIIYLPLSNAIEGFNFSDAGLCVALSGVLSFIPDMIITPFLRTKRSRCCWHMMFLLFNQLGHACLFLAYWKQNKVWIFAFAVLVGFSNDMTFTIANAFGNPDHVSVGVLHSRMSHFGRWYKLASAIVYFVQWAYLQLGYLPVTLICTGFGTVRLILHALLYCLSLDRDKVLDQAETIEFEIETIKRVREIAACSRSFLSYAFSVSSRQITDSKEMGTNMTLYASHTSRSVFYASYLAHPQINSEETLINPSSKGWTILYYFFLMVHFTCTIITYMIGGGVGVYLNSKFGFPSDIGGNACGVGYFAYVAFTFFDMRLSAKSVLKVFPTNLIIPFVPMSIMLVICFSPFTVILKSVSLWSLIISFFLFLVAFTDVQMLVVRQTVIHPDDSYKFNIAMNLCYRLVITIFGLAILPLIEGSYTYEWVMQGCFVVSLIIISVLFWIWRSSTARTKGEIGARETSI